MLKTGIYRTEQLNDPKQLIYRSQEDKKISITLYHSVIDDPSKTEIAEQILLNFTDERGAYKRTYSNRFEDFDQQTLKEIQRYFTQDHPLMLHDAGVSDGRTSCDFFHKIQPLFPKVNYHASDYDPQIFTIESGRTKVVLNKHNKVLEIVFPPFVFNGNRDAYRYPINHIIRYLLDKTLIKRLLSKYQQGLIKAQMDLLFCHQAIALSQNDKRFHLEQHDLLKALPVKNSIDIFRAMNILNPSYFSRQEFETILTHIYDGLTKQGLFITGSNEESNTTVNGGIFQKTLTGFEKVGHSGTGSAIESIISNYRSPRQD
jgi:hypothetical protein